MWSNLLYMKVNEEQLGSLVTNRLSVNHRCNLAQMTQVWADDVPCCLDAQFTDTSSAKFYELIQVITEKEYAECSAGVPVREVPACLEQSSMQLAVPVSGESGAPCEGGDEALEEMRRRLKTAELAPHLRRRRGSFLKHAQSSGLMLNVRGFRKGGEEDEGEIDMDLFAATNITANLSG